MEDQALEGHAAKYHDECAAMRLLLPCRFNNMGQFSIRILVGRFRIKDWNGGEWRNAIKCLVSTACSVVDCVHLLYGQAVRELTVNNTGNSIMIEMVLVILTCALILKSSINAHRKVNGLAGNKSDRAYGIVWLSLALACVAGFIGMFGFDVSIAAWCLLAAGTIGNIQNAYLMYHGEAVA